MTPEKLLRALRRHFDRRGFGDVEILDRHFEMQLLGYERLWPVGGTVLFDALRGQINARTFEGNEVVSLEDHLEFEQRAIERG